MACRPVHGTSPVRISLQSVTPDSVSPHHMLKQNHPMTWIKAPAACYVFIEQVAACCAVQQSAAFPGATDECMMDAWINSHPPTHQRQTPKLYTSARSSKGSHRSISGAILHKSKAASSALRCGLLHQLELSLQAWLFEVKPLASTTVITTRRCQGSRLTLIQEPQSTCTML